MLNSQRLETLAFQKEQILEEARQEVHQGQPSISLSRQQSNRPVIPPTRPHTLPITPPPLQSHHSAPPSIQNQANPSSETTTRPLWTSINTPPNSLDLKESIASEIPTNSVDSTPISSPVPSSPAPSSFESSSLKQLVVYLYLYTRRPIHRKLMKWTKHERCLSIPMI